MTQRRTPDLYDLVRELCETTQHREYYERKRKPRYHVTSNQPLLVQLLLTAYPSTTRSENTNHTNGSRPAANVDALDTIHHIRTEAATWLRALGHDDTGRIVNLIRRLTAALPTVDHCHRARAQRDNTQPSHPITCCTWHRAEADIRRWWIRARIATGWDLPPWRPDNTCPACTHRGTLRIRVIEKLATCTHDECGATWDDTTLGLLADHIRRENGEHHEEESA